MFWTIQGQLTPCRKCSKIPLATWQAWKLCRQPGGPIIWPFCVQCSLLDLLRVKRRVLELAGTSTWEHEWVSLGRGGCCSLSNQNNMIQLHLQKSVILKSNCFRSLKEWKHRDNLQCAIKRLALATAWRQYPLPSSQDPPNMLYWASKGMA